MKTQTLIKQSLSRSSKPVSLSNLYKYFLRQFQLSYSETRDARHSADILLEYLLKRRKIALVSDDEKTKISTAAFEESKDRCLMSRSYMFKLNRQLFVNRKPLEHIVGECLFYGRSFSVSKHVLICRQDSEVLIDCLKDNCIADSDEEQQDTYSSLMKEYVRTHFVERKHEEQKQTFKIESILDLCSGSGCLLLTALLEIPTVKKAVGVDVSRKALSVARRNEQLLSANISNNGERNVEVSWIQEDLHALCTGKSSQLHEQEALFDCILCNPPYIPSADCLSLDAEVRDHEPRIALDGGESGLDFYRILASHGHHFLKDNGILLVEFGIGQGASVKEVFCESGGDGKWEWIETRRDWSSIERVMCFRKCGPEQQ